MPAMQRARSVSAAAPSPGSGSGSCNNRVLAKMESDLSLEFLRVTEQAAVACAHTMGQGDRHTSDQVAVEAMRREMDTVPIDGTVVIGEGERDEAPMLYIGEKVGMAHSKKGNGRVYPPIDIAVDPLE